MNFLLLFPLTPSLKDYEKKKIQKRNKESETFMVTELNDVGPVLGAPDFALVLELPYQLGLELIDKGWSSKTNNSWTHFCWLVFQAKDEDDDDSAEDYDSVAKLDESTDEKPRKRRNT